MVAHPPLFNTTGSRRGACAVRLCSFWIAWIAVSIPAFAQDRPEIDLTRAVELALKQNRTLALTALDTRSAEYRLAAAEAEFELSVRPVVELNTTGPSESRSTLGITVSRKLPLGTEVSGSILREELEGTGNAQERAIIEISQPLFRFYGRLVNEEAIVLANSDLLRARRQLNAQNQDLIVEVVRSYEDILRLEQQLSADQQAFERADALYRSTRAKEAVGRATRIDTLRVELQRGQAMARVGSDRELLKSARTNFAQLLGMEPDIEFDLAPTRLLEAELPGVEKSVDIAFENRMDYAQAIQDYNDAERGVRIARHGLWPDVRLVGRYEALNDSVFSSEERNEWSLGLRVDTEFNRSRERAGLYQAQVNEQASKQVISILELSIARDVQQRILNYRRAHEELGILRKNVEHAKARLQLAQRLFEIGRGDNFTVTDAEQAFVLAEIQWLSGRSDASVSSYELLRAMGTLTTVPENLKAANAW